MEESDDNVSSEDINCITSPSLKTKPKKRSLVERELETSLTAKITSPISYGEATSTSRYGRARRFKQDVGTMDMEKTDCKLLAAHNDMSPTRALSAYKMHASNSPIRTESVKDDLDNQIENIYNENISLSRFGSEEKKSKQANAKIYIRKDLIQTKDKEETVLLIKNMFSPGRSDKSNSDLTYSSEKCNKKHKEDLSSVVKTLDFGGKKKKKDCQEKRMSQTDLFDLEAQCGYQVGDLAWARMGTYPFWPSIVTREPTSMLFIKKKLIGRLEKDIIHVTFLGDNGRRGWMLESMLRKYLGLHEFESARESFTPEAKKRDPRLYAAFFISEKRLPLWHVSVEEAEVLLKEPKRLRIDILHAMLSKVKESKGIPVKSKKVVRTNSDVSLSESLYDSLFSEDDCKNSDTESSRSKARNKSFDVSDVVTACLDNMAAKTGITKIQKQSHMDIWLQKAKSKTPEKCQYKQTKSEKKTKINTKINMSSRNNSYRLRKRSTESRGEREIEIKLSSHQSEHDYTQSAFTNGHIIDDIDLVDSGSNLSDPRNELSYLSSHETASNILYNNVSDNEAKGISIEVTDENCTEIEVITNEDITVQSCDINDLIITSEQENSGINNEKAIFSEHLSTKSSNYINRNDEFTEVNEVNENQQNPETLQETKSKDISTNFETIDNDCFKIDESIEMLNENVSNPVLIKIVNKCVNNYNQDTQSNDKSDLYCTDEADKILQNTNVVHTSLFENIDKSHTNCNAVNDMSDLSTTDETVNLLENVINNSLRKENEYSEINHDKDNQGASDSNLKCNSNEIPNKQTATTFLALAQVVNISNDAIISKDVDSMSKVSVMLDEHDIIEEQASDKSNSDLTYSSEKCNKKQQVVSISNDAIISKDVDSMSKVSVMLDEHDIIEEQNNINIDSNYSSAQIIHKNVENKLITQTNYNEKKTSKTEQIKDNLDVLILNDQSEGIRENDVGSSIENFSTEDNTTKISQYVIQKNNTEDTCDISLMCDHKSNEGDLKKTKNVSKGHILSASISSSENCCTILNEDVESLTVKTSDLISIETQNSDIVPECDGKKESDHIQSDLVYSDISGELCQDDKDEDITKTRVNHVESKLPSDVNGLKNVEFLKYFEQKQDSVIDENPELTDEEVKAYLYKTWKYEESLKSERKILDDIEQSKLVKGLDQPAPEKKNRKKSLRLKSDKCKQTLINFKVVPKDMKTENKKKSLRNNLILNETTAQKEILTDNNLDHLQTDENKLDIFPTPNKENILKLAENSKNHLINDLPNNTSMTTLNANIIPATNSKNIEIKTKYVNESEKTKIIANNIDASSNSDYSNSDDVFVITINSSEQAQSKENVESKHCRVENYFDLTLDSESNDSSSTKNYSLNKHKKYTEDKSHTNIGCDSKDTTDKDHSKELLINKYKDKCTDILYIDMNNKTNCKNEYIESTSDCEIRETVCSRASTLSCEDSIKTKDDLEVISIKSGESEISLSKRKTRKEKHPQNKTSLENPDFLKYLELRQDELIDEHPELSQEEITTYLYNTWSYEENMKSENKKSDDLDQRNLVKGLNEDPVSVKRVRKKVKVEKEKDYSGNYEEVIPKDKSKRRTERQFYREDYSDCEDELELFQIFKSDSTVKNEPENSKVDDTNEKVLVNKVENNCDEIVAEKDITEQFDQVEEYFRQLTEPKPNLFKGLVREKVCEICEKIGNLVKCKGCYGMFHVDCTKKVVELKESPIPVRGRKKKRKNRGRKPKGLDDSYEEHSDDRSQDRDMSIEYEPESYTIANADEFEEKLSAKLKELIDNPGTKYDTHSSDEELSWSDTDVGKCKVVDIIPKKKTTIMTDFKCKSCEEYDIPVCFVCKGAVSPKKQIAHRQKCQIAHCKKYYHMECLEHWPQTQLSTGERSKKGPEFLESLTCPRHVCHTCVCDDPRGCKTRFSGDKLARCVRCPATYHSFTKCLPAGSQVLTGSLIVCPRHYEHRPGKVPCHVNTGWCFICALGGSLICCEYCPTSFHAECLNIEPPEGGYMCEDCETGCLPLYGEMVWVKLGHYRWWPGLILHPSEIPENILAVKHYPGEYVVRFFGQYDHYWVNRGRVFPFQEGDTGRVSSKNSKIDAAFTMAVEHAQRAYEILKNAAPRTEDDEDIASSLRPPHYVKLKVNRPRGPLARRPDARRPDAERSLAACECDPAERDPCGPYSHCLNRMLLTECGPECRAGSRCSNRAFERREYPRLEPYRTAARGWGLRTLQDIRAGQFVIEYVGELIDEEEFQRRMRWKHEVRDENYYFLTLDKERMIDAGPKGNLARFMNHSCEPNCETQKWTVLGDVRVGLFALHDIPAKSELTFNYNLECAGIEKKRCMCGARRCSGFMGAKPKDEPKKSKLTPKRTYKKRKPIELSPTTSLSKPKRGRPRHRELTDIEKDLLIITSASQGVSSDSEGSGRRNSFDSLNSLKRKRVNFEDSGLLSPTTKRTKVDRNHGIGKAKSEEIPEVKVDGGSDRTELDVKSFEVD